MGDVVCLLRISFIELKYLSVNLLNKGFDSPSYDMYSRNLWLTIMSFCSNMVVLLIIFANLVVRLSNGLSWIMLGQLNIYRVSGSHLPLCR